MKKRADQLKPQMVINYNTGRDHVRSVVVEVHDPKVRPTAYTVFAVIVWVPRYGVRPAPYNRLTMVDVLPD